MTFKTFILPARVDRGFILRKITYLQCGAYEPICGKYLIFIAQGSGGKQVNQLVLYHRRVNL